MRYLLQATLLSLLLLPAPAAAQLGEFSALTIPAALKENAHSVVRSVDYHWEVTSDHQAKLTVRRVVTVLDGLHDRESQLFIHYADDSKVTRFKATLYDRLGEKIREARKSEISDVRASGASFHDDSRVLVTKFDVVSYPYTVEFEYETKARDFSMVAGFPKIIPVKYRQSCERATYVALVPIDNELRHFSTELPEPNKATVDGKQQFTWELKNFAAQKEEAESPPLTETLPFLAITLDRFSIDGYAGSMATWEEFGTFIGTLLKGRDALPEGLKLLVQEKTVGLTTDVEKIDALYRLMQDRTRYVSVQLGIGGWQPFPVAYVEENKYGDCKALSNYMGAMLNEVGIESYPVLVNWNDDEFFPSRPAFTASSFNHVILYVPGEDMYLECTSSDAPTGYLGEGKDARNVLLITPTGGKLVATPAVTPADNGRIRTLAVDIQADGTAALVISGRYHGFSHEDFRSLLSHEKDRSKQLKYLSDRTIIPDVSGGKYSLSVAHDAPVANLEYATEVKNYVRKMGKRTFVPINKYGSFDYIPEKNDDRRTKLFNTYARFFVDTISLTFPADLEIESLGEAETSYEHAAGEYRATVSVVGNQLTWVRTLKILPVDLPASAYPEYRQFFVNVAEAENRMVVLRDRRTK
ncbi:DUF3857 domain-containing protein [Neolewinella antarctica]|uniref:Transglutaminase-like putative cysteine protease n=1 Tax=Neolewinella antarctica TaxID=442734 RepID=A0ABX0X732_9BACT|nr:DUF3857 domain-containing protein [Neolewinella antarctica]NJC25032.1 transglutaminase-like putative cysteine protease [Neolewinella antarctica]